METEYVFTEETYDALAGAGVDWREVIHVLHHAAPVERRWISEDALLVTGLDSSNRMLVVALLESPTVDELYEVVAARYLGEGDERSPREGR